MNLHTGALNFRPFFGGVVGVTLFDVRLGFRIHIEVESGDSGRRGGDNVGGRKDVVLLTGDRTSPL